MNLTSKALLDFLLEQAKLEYSSLENCNLHAKHIDTIRAYANVAKHFCGIYPIDFNAAVESEQVHI